MKPAASVETSPRSRTGTEVLAARCNPSDLWRSLRHLWIAMALFLVGVVIWAPWHAMIQMTAPALGPLGHAPLIGSLAWFSVAMWQTQRALGEGMLARLSYALAGFFPLANLLCGVIVQWEGHRVLKRAIDTREDSCFACGYRFGNATITRCPECGVPRGCTFEP